MDTTKLRTSIHHCLILALGASLSLSLSSGCTKDDGDPVGDGDGDTSGDGDGDTSGDGDGDLAACPAGQTWVNLGCMEQPTGDYADFTNGCHVPCDGDGAACAEGSCQLVWYENICPCPPWEDGCCEACGGGDFWICLP